ncbi:hypothetical protein ACLOAV_004601 [Pseudogymnoascus australis]
MTTKRTSRELTTGWSFKQTDDLDAKAWLPVNRVPSTVHQDLMDNKRLDDPFLGYNEMKAQWVGTKSWTYRTKLKLDKFYAVLGSKIVLAFDGLDTFANVRLNGQTILESDNMFLPCRADITNMVTSGGEYDLEVKFDPALLRAEEIKKQHPQHKWLDFDGETSRPAARKAQYHWGWDWGPVLMCAGIWKPVRLEIYSARISDIRTDIDIAADYKYAMVHVVVECESTVKDELYAEISITLGGKNISNATSRVTSGGLISADLNISRPLLWMPSGYGTQTLYHVEVKLFSNGKEMDSDARRIGIRKVELVQELGPCGPGKSFYFRINDIDVFCGGSNWIPGDAILTNISPERYRAWIKLMVSANQIMTRVWGGGIYEHDAFYDACDELGVLVWQDFMFACANYPTYPSILASITAEAQANVRRLRHHPSIIIFAGNNEDYQVRESKSLTYDYADKNEENWLKSDFPARYIYESLLPKIMSAEAPTIPYHPGSPWGDGKETTDPTVGDKHAWNVWHSPQEKYQVFDLLGGRFNSEFGMQAFPHLATIKKFGLESQDMFPQSQLLDFRNKNDSHERRIATYLAENVRVATDLKSHIHLTQLIQSETMTFAYRGWRKQWGNRHCGGALVWQLNDCWPVISWSICDYYLLPKPSYYAIKRALAPVAVGIRREHWDWTGPQFRFETVQSWELWVASSRLEEVEADVEVRFISIKSGKDVKAKVLKRVKVAANGTTSVMSGSIDHASEDAEPHVLAARLWVNNQLVARDMDWPQPLKYLQFPERNVKVEHRGNIINVAVERPVKCLVFEEMEGCYLSDNGIDLVPGDEQVISVGGIRGGDVGKDLDYTYLGHGEQVAGREP